jgi:hypothetical protein
MLITVSREVLLAIGWTGYRMEESTPIDFGAVLGDVLGAAQRTFPTLCLPPDVFVAYLRERLPPDLPPPIALRRMHTSDLYLACAHGHADAIAVDGATLDELARLYRVHRATVARMLGRARELVLAATRNHLVSQLEVPSQDIDSILRMIWSRIEISLRAVCCGRRR